LKIITAISNVDTEQIISSLLFTQGFDISYRALSFSNLFKFIKSNSEPMIIVHSNNFFTISELGNVLKLNNKNRFIEVNLDSFSALELLSDLSNLSQNIKTYRVERLNNVCAVMGTPGSPGVSTLTNFLALHLSGAVIAASHHNLRPKSSAKTLIITLEALTESIKSLNSTRILIDSGSAINLTSTFSDRRVNSRWLKEVVGTCSQLFYVAKSDDLGIEYLAKFVSDLENLIDPPEITFILNQQRFDRSGQEMQTRFRSLINGSRYFILPFTNRLAQEVSRKNMKTSYWRANSYQKQIAKIGAQLL
jgi:hypothetical protein